MNLFPGISRPAILLLALSISKTLLAQSLIPALHQHRADISGIVQQTRTIPGDDAVLDSAPTELSLVFPQQVRLVKLTLRNDSRDWVDINFRYSPRSRDNYSWTLPELNPASYYTADWAILSTNDQLVRGSFSFSFGIDAKPPSIIKEADELLLQLRYGDPNVRSVMPPRTEIIINRDPPRFDPPFTIKLDDAVKDDPN